MMTAKYAVLCDNAIQCASWLVSGKVKALVIRLLPSPLSSKMDSSKT